MNNRGPGSAHETSLTGPRIVALILVAGGALLIHQSLSIRQGGGFSVIGPAAVPLAVSVALLLLGLFLAARTTIRPDSGYGEEVAREEHATHWPTVGLLLLVLLVYALALNGLRVGPLTVPGAGFVIATGLFLPAAARVLGSRQLLRDLIIGFVIAIVVYIGFTQYLGVRLPAGPLRVLG